MERAESGESVTGAGGSVPILGARNERKCRLGDAGQKAWCCAQMKWTTLPHPGPLPPARRGPERGKNPAVIDRRYNQTEERSDEKFNQSVRDSG